MLFPKQNIKPIFSKKKAVSSKKATTNKVLKNLEIIEKLTQSRYLREGDLVKALNEILKKAAEILKVKRVNIWVFDKEITKLTCVACLPAKELNGMELHKKDIPKYFSNLIKGNSVVINNCLKETVTTELLDSYILPKKITAILDIPIRIVGNLKGTICFEHVGTKRKWTLLEQKYALFIAQLVSMALEIKEKKETKILIERSIKDKEILLQEMNHRIKNNVMIIEGILMLQAEKAKDSYHKNLFKESKTKLHSITKIHELLYKTKTYTQINMRNYLSDLAKEIILSCCANQQIKLTIDVKPILLDVSQATNCGLIVNELLTNSYKHAFKNSADNSSKEVCVMFDRVNGKNILRVCDNGEGYNPKIDKKGKLGLALVSDLVLQLEGKITYTNKGRSIFLIEF